MKLWADQFSVPPLARSDNGVCLSITSRETKCPIRQSKHVELCEPDVHITIKYTTTFYGNPIHVDHSSVLKYILCTQQLCRELFEQQLQVIFVQCKTTQPLHHLSARFKTIHLFLKITYSYLEFPDCVHFALYITSRAAYKSKCSHNVSAVLPLKSRQGWFKY